MTRLAKLIFPALLLLLTNLAICKGQTSFLLNAKNHPKFENQLPIPEFSNPTKTGGNYYEISITQFPQYLGLKDKQGNQIYTTVWGYNGKYPGPTFKVVRGSPVKVKWINNLKDQTGKNLPHLFSVDTTIRWAKPNNWPKCGVPTVVHLHGGHTESASDGFPEAWFTPGFEQQGAYFIKDVYDYSYPQEETTLWYHDHTLGISRLNVYAGLAGFYIITDEWEKRLKLPEGDYDIPLIIQDKMFTTNGQLYYPSKSKYNNTIGRSRHSHRIAEDIPNQNAQFGFYGDFILVNGMVWPYLNVEPRKYRFRLLNGSDARFYSFKFDEGLPFIQIASDGGFLDEPISQDSLMLIPGERKEIILDFSNPDLWGKKLILKNTAVAPFPNGDTTDARSNGIIMAFNVKVPLKIPDKSQIPERLRPSTIQSLGIENNIRQVTLSEMEDLFGRSLTLLGTPKEGPLRWDSPITENPKLNDIEIWEIINTTPDALPIHLHLADFQVINSQAFDTSLYEPGRPETLLLTGDPILPMEAERGWKDTQLIYPGMVTRIKAKFDQPGFYVWHCQILTHEDHEMTRPYFVGEIPTNIANPIATNNRLSVYPNPFKAETEISISTQRRDNLKLNLYNSRGEIISTIAEGNFPEGDHKFLLKDNNLQNGLYVIKVFSSTKTESIKVIHSY